MDGRLFESGEFLGFETDGTTVWLEGVQSRGRAAEGSRPRGGQAGRWDRWMEEEDLRLTQSQPAVLVLTVGWIDLQQSIMFHKMFFTQKIFK